MTARCVQDQCLIFVAVDQEPVTLNVALPEPLPFPFSLWGLALEDNGASSHRASMTRCSLCTSLPRFCCRLMPLANRFSV